MKTLIVTLIISALSLVNSDAGAKQLYKNVEKDNVENTITTFIYEGEKEMNLKPLRKQVLKLTENGDAQEKIIYTWSDSKHDWTEAYKYEYFSNSSGDIEYLSYTKWNKPLEMWETDIQYTMFIYSTEGDLLTVNQ